MKPEETIRSISFRDAARLTSVMQQSWGGIAAMIDMGIVDKGVRCFDTNVLKEMERSEGVKVDLAVILVSQAESPEGAMYAYRMLHDSKSVDLVLPVSEEPRDFSVKDLDENPFES